MPGILLINDDIAEISVVKRILLRAGHQALLATNSSDAASAVTQEAPQLAIISVTCEGGEGLKLAKRLADDTHTAGLPLILLGESTDAPPSATQLPRPIDPAQLAESIQAALQTRSPGATPSAAQSKSSVPPSGERAPEPAHGRHPAADAERRAAADALRQRAEELRRTATVQVGSSAREPNPAAGRAEFRAPERTSLSTAVADASRSIAEKLAAQELLELAQEEERREADGLEEQRRAKIEEELSQLAEEADEEQLRATIERTGEQALDTLSQTEEEETKRRAEVEAATRAAQAAARAAEAGSRAAEEETRRRADAKAQTRAKTETRRKVEEPAKIAARPAKEETRRRAEAEAQARAQAEERRQAEEQARIAARAAEEEARRRAEAEAQARAQAEARRQAEEQARRRVEAANAARAVAEEARRRAAAEAAARATEEETRWRAQMEALAQAEAEARRQAEQEEASARQAEEKARRERKERDAARSAEEEAVRQRIRALAASRKTKAPPTPSVEPPPPPRLASPETTAEVAGIPALPELSTPPQELISGTLAETPMPRLLTMAASVRLTGRLDFGGDTPRSLYLEDGRVVGVTSAAPYERVEEVALRLGLLTRDQHRLATSGAIPLPSRRAAMSLLERGWLKPTELTQLVRRRTEEVAFALFGETTAPFRHAAARVPGDERIALDRNTLELVIDGIRRKWLAPQLDAALGGAGSLLAPGPQSALTSELGLSAGERRALELADGLRTLDEIVADSPIESLSTRQVLAAAVMTGILLLQYRDGGRTAQEVPSIDLARVQEKLDQVRRADYFTILGLARRCTPYEIREAAERLSNEFDAQRFTGVSEPGLADKLAEIRQVVAEAQEVLSDDILRREYLAALRD